MAAVATAMVAALAAHPCVRGVTLVGSRQRGTATLLSDWDFAVDVADFRAVATALPDLLAPLTPLAQQWDRLSRQRAYLVMLAGPIKVDLVFVEPNAPAPPWEVRADRLQALDDHFWDWVYWLASKVAAGKQAQATAEFAKLDAHLLRPLGVHSAPTTIEAAIAAYRAARAEAERRLGVRVRRPLGREVCRGLRAAGFIV